jgi:hypothetical protein
MDLFTMIKHLFSHKQIEWDKIKRNDKAKNYFMINRFFAIQFPVQAQAVNRNGIDGAAIVDMWKVVGSKFTKPPGWIYTKTKKSKNNTALPKLKEYPKHLVDMYLKVNKIGLEDYRILLENHPKEMKKHFERLDKIISNDEKPNVIK